MSAESEQRSLLWQEQLRPARSRLDQRYGRPDGRDGNRCRNGGRPGPWPHGDRDCSGIPTHVRDSQQQCAQMLGPKPIWTARDRFHAQQRDGQRGRPPLNGKPRHDQPRGRADSKPGGVWRGAYLRDSRRQLRQVLGLQRKRTTGLRFDRQPRRLDWRDGRPIHRRSRRHGPHRDGDIVWYFLHLCYSRHRAGQVLGAGLVRSARHRRDERSRFQRGTNGVPRDRQSRDRPHRDGDIMWWQPRMRCARQRPGQMLG